MKDKLFFFSFERLFLLFIFSFSITLCFDSTKSPIPEVDWSHCILDPTKGRQEQGIPEVSCVVKVAQLSSAYWLTSLVTYINVHLNVSYNSGNCKLPHNFIFSAAIDTIYNTCRTRDTMSYTDTIKTRGDLPEYVPPGI